MWLDCRLNLSPMIGHFVEGQKINGPHSALTSAHNHFFAPSFSVVGIACCPCRSFSVPLLFSSYQITGAHTIFSEGSGLFCWIFFLPCPNPLPRFRFYSLLLIFRCLTIPQRLFFSTFTTSSHQPECIFSHNKPSKCVRCIPPPSSTCPFGQCRPAGLVDRHRHHRQIEQLEQRLLTASQPRRSTPTRSRSCKHESSPSQRRNHPPIDDIYTAARARIGVGGCVFGSGLGIEIGMEIGTRIRKTNIDETATCSPLVVRSVPPRHWLPRSVLWVCLPRRSAKISPRPLVTGYVSAKWDEDGGWGEG